MRDSIHRHTWLTSVLGGSGLLIAGLIWLLGAVHAGTHNAFLAPIPSFIGDVVLLAACVLLAWAVPGETGIVGASALGRAALVVFGVRNLVLGIVQGLPYTPGAWPILTLNSVLIAIFAAALLVAALIARRVRAAPYMARAVLLIVALLFAVITVLALIPAADVGLFLAEIRADVILAAALTALGLSFVLSSLSRRG